ncbi:unnamed protein product [Protopolystoma xenopodis]|uniref:Uncharacterized protein n=1 Tax=Protopolystoma xenopodis TaxID=117903 RepID=A0A448X3R5_9PLAT|nr:unnamed protein product [Protopolystoma xenopodis]
MLVAAMATQGSGSVCFMRFKQTTVAKTKCQANCLWRREMLWLESALLVTPKPGIRDLRRRENGLSGGCCDLCAAGSWGVKPGLSAKLAHRPTPDSMACAVKLRCHQSEADDETCFPRPACQERQWSMDPSRQGPVIFDRMVAASMGAAQQPRNLEDRGYRNGNPNRPLPQKVFCCCWT